MKFHLFINNKSILEKFNKLFYYILGTKYPRETSI